MKIIAMPDIHGDIKKIAKLKTQLSEVDLVLLVGDITNFGHQEKMLEIIQLVQDINPEVITVPGNCDYQDTETVMDDIGTNLNGRTRSIEGKTFAGLGGSLYTPFNGTPFEVTEEYFQEKLDSLSSGINSNEPLIFLSHQPPINTTADGIPNGMHVGSKVVREFIEQYQPLVCFTGHIHEGKGIDHIGKTKVINPGPVFKGNYAYAEISDKLDLLEIRSIR
jgi:uncharacterized protein